MRPSLGFAGTLLQLWRAKLLMFLVFAPIALIGIAVTLVTPTKYSASTRLLVRLGQDYALDPTAGDAARGAPPQQEEMLQAAMELAHSPVIAERVINRIGLNRLYPDLAGRSLHIEDGRIYSVDQNAIDLFAKDIGVSSAPKSLFIRFTYAHRQPQLAADTLNAFVAEYLIYRGEILTGRGASGLSEQRGVIEERLKAADEALQDHLARNSISDFDAENSAAIRLFSEVSGELSRADASLGEANAKTQGLKRQMQTTPKTIDLFVETGSGQDVRRTGPNPTFQALEADEAAQTASIAALAGKSLELTQQKAEAERRLAALARLAPDYQRLKRQRDALEASANAFAAREQGERTRSEMASRVASDISLYETARPPVREDPRRRVIAGGFALFGALLALTVGLLRVWSIRTFPTAGALERTLGMRVLASAGDR